jgi:hypothetical protein
MNRQRVLWVPLVVCLLVLLLAVAPSAKADDVLYTFDSNLGNFSWSFETPSIITTDTTITSFLNFNAVPGSPLFGCSGAESARLLPVQEGFFPPQIVTVVGTCGSTSQTLPTFTSLGTFTVGSGGTLESLTISEATSSVPEPSSILLLAVGVAGVMGWRRKK